MGYSDFHSFRRLFLFSPNPALIHSKLKESLRNHVTNFPAASRLRRFITIDIDRLCLWHFLHLEFKYFIAVVPCKKPLPSCTPHTAVTQINRSCKAVSAWFLGGKNIPPFQDWEVSPILQVSFGSDESGESGACSLEDQSVILPLAVDLRMSGLENGACWKMYFLFFTLWHSPAMFVYWSVLNEKCL